MHSFTTSGCCIKEMVDVATHPVYRVQACMNFQVTAEQKEEVYAGRRVWEALDRLWCPFSASHNDVGKQASCLSMGVQMVACKYLLMAAG